MTRLICVPGIGESAPGDQLHTLRRHLPDWDHTVIRWSASYGPVNDRFDIFGQSFEASLADGMARLRAGLDRGPAMVVGYSGGAAVAGHVAARGHRNLRTVGLVADPFAPGNPLIHGIAGRRPIAGVPARWVSHRDDVICCCPTDSPLRTIADASAAMSLGDPVGWGRDVEARLRSGRMAALFRRPWDVVGEYRRFDRAFWHVHGYLTSAHTSYGRIGPQPHGHTYLQELATWLRGQA